MWEVIYHFLRYSRLSCLMVIFLICKYFLTDNRHLFDSVVDNISCILNSNTYYSILFGVQKSLVSIHVHEELFNGLFHVISRSNTCAITCNNLCPTTF